MKYGLFFLLFLLILIVSPLEAASPQTTWSTNPNDKANRGSVRSGNIGELRQKGRVEKSYKFTEQQESIILQAHNTARSNVLPPATNMKKMTWDAELAELALHYSEQCVFEHNQNRGLDKYWYVGENIYVSSGKQFNNKYAEDSVIAWDDEKKDYDFNNNACVPGKMCGHYTQVVWSSSSKVGCGASKCSSIQVNGNVWSDATILICNYGPGGNINEQQPYIAGQQQCSDCSGDLNLCENRLCTKNSGNEITPTLPVSTMWGSWKSWSSCSKTCGGGIRKRSRVCNNGAQTDCNGNANQKETCNTKSCAPVWRKWGPWSQCTKSCGRGTRSRSRVCSSGTVSDCRGRSKQTRRCNLMACESEETGSAQWSKWNAWSKCSATCGTGLKWRKRECENQTYDDFCQGRSIQVSYCENSQNCETSFNGIWW